MKTKWIEIKYKLVDTKTATSMNEGGELRSYFNLDFMDKVDHHLETEVKDGHVVVTKDVFYFNHDKKRYVVDEPTSVHILTSAFNQRI